MAKRQPIAHIGYVDHAGSLPLSGRALLRTRPCSLGETATRSCTLFWPTHAPLCGSRFQFPIAQ